MWYYSLEQNYSSDRLHFLLVEVSSGHESIMPTRKIPQLFNSSSSSSEHDIKALTWEYFMVGSLLMTAGGAPFPLMGS